MPTAASQSQSSARQALQQLFEVQEKHHKLWLDHLGHLFFYLQSENFLLGFQERCWLQQSAAVAVVVAAAAAAAAEAEAEAEKEEVGRGNGDRGHGVEEGKGKGWEDG